MKGIIYHNLDNKVILVVDDVMSVTEVDVIGKDACAYGIDRTQASFYIVESSDLHVGDVVDVLLDSRDKLPKTAEQLRIEQEARLADVELALIEIFSGGAT